MMRAVEFLGASRSRLVSRPVPEPTPGYVVVRVLYNATCGSDLWLFRGQWHGGSYPVVPGHEWSGVVSATTPENTGWLGRRVVGELATGCGMCRPCRAGMPVLCPDVDEIGFTSDGALAEYVRVPLRNLHTIPDAVDDLAACQTEPLAVAVHAVRRLHVAPGDRVAVLGCGAIGLLLLQAAHAVGAEVILAAEPVPLRRSVASALGATAAVDPTTAGFETLHSIADVVFEASGEPSSIAAAMRLAAPLGRIGLIGYQVGQYATVPTAQWPLKMLTVTGVMGPSRYYQHALSLLASDRIDTARLLTNVEPLEAHEKALPRAIERSEVVRIVFAPSL
ncbi:zinc-binding dehydrogenase [Streptomyces erythrochromogenes]|uniref:zinc-dependent alcohol dehydrogenase n=1 Tax=Streptomyces erythrochromogenes TaxID=285574 RepID=UPI003626DCBD